MLSNDALKATWAYVRALSTVRLNPSRVPRSVRDIVMSVPFDRLGKEVFVGDPNRPQKRAWRARIILFSTERMPGLAIANRAGTSRSTVWRWQRRFAEGGVDGLLRDKARGRRAGRRPPHQIHV